VGESHYDVLGVSPLAEDVVIEGAYKALVKRYHLGRNRGQPRPKRRRRRHLHRAEPRRFPPDLRCWL
jgi:curved DNA-binding protein CbpA